MKKYSDKAAYSSIMQKKFKPSLIMILLTIISSSSMAQQIASWTLQSNGNATAIGPGITAHPMGIGAGVIDNGFTSFCGGGGCNGRQIRGWTNGTTSISSATGAVANNKYVEFSFSVDAGAQPVIVTNFQFTGSAGFANNCTGAAGFALRWLIDGVHATPQWLRHPSACGGELLYNINNGNNGNCVTYNISGASSGACATPFPITVNPGQRIRFRIYIGTTHNSGTNNSSHWRALFGNVNILGENPLPVTLTDFSADCSAAYTQINWTTTTEQNASHFLLERSRDGYLWDEVEKIAAAGTTTILQNYSVQDNIQFNGVGYYRLRQFDYNGMEETFGPISVNCANQGNGISIFPNPASDNIQIEILSNEEFLVGNLQIIDLKGKLVWSKEVQIVNGVNNLFVTLEQFSSGMYFVRVITNDENVFVSCEKLLIQK